MPRDWAGFAWADWTGGCADAGRPSADYGKRIRREVNKLNLLQQLDYMSKLIVST